jgi:tRNA pseudouridine32 synthase/23S rRNA pseudouridine746 synthase
MRADLQKGGPPRIPPRHRPRGLTILYEDRDVIVVDKEPGVLTTRTRRDEAFTAEEVISNYLRKGQARSTRRAYLVHRLDRETSGLLMFAKSEEAQQRIKDNWPNNEKYYLAVVEGRLDRPEGTFESYLAENQDFFVRSVPDPALGKLARTQYTLIRETPEYSVVKIRLLTGRKNQIRAHFSEAGNPVVGDAKYGAEVWKRDDRLYLHAKVLAFDQPFTGERLRFETPIPPAFTRLIRGLTERDWNNA